MENIYNHIRKICNAIGNGFGDDKERRDKALSVFEATINSMGDYINCVLYMETGLQVARFRLEGQELRDRIMELDRRRRLAHDAMLGRVSALNRICGMVGCEPFFAGDVADRYKVADYAMTVTQALFVNRNQSSKQMSLEDIQKVVEAKADGE